MLIAQCEAATSRKWLSSRFITSGASVTYGSLVGAGDFVGFGVTVGFGVLVGSGVAVGFTVGFGVEVGFGVAVASGAAVTPGRDLVNEAEPAPSVFLSNVPSGVTNLTGTPDIGVFQNCLSRLRRISQTIISGRLTYSNKSLS